MYPAVRLDDRRPHFAAQARGGAVHIFGRDGITLIATVHPRPGCEQLAARMAATEELFEAAEKAVAADDAGDSRGFTAAWRELAAALAKARRPPITT